MLTALQGPVQAAIKCPECDAAALYRYGRTKHGKQRFLCLLCGRQFTPDSSRRTVKDKPTCGNCGRLMHLYKRTTTSLRFRCSDYPRCRTYIKISCGDTAE